MEGVTRLAPQAGAVFQSLGTMRDGKSDTSEASHDELLVGPQDDMPQSLDAWREARIRRDSEAVRTSKPPRKPNRVSLRGPAYRAWVSMRSRRVTSARSSAYPPAVRRPLAAELDDAWCDRLPRDTDLADRYG